MHSKAKHTSARTQCHTAKCQNPWLCCSFNNTMYCYCTGEVHWQRGNINKKVNNVLLLLLLKQNLKFLFSLC